MQVALFINHDALPHNLRTHQGMHDEHEEITFEPFVQTFVASAAAEWLMK